MKNFIILFEEKEGTSPLVRILDHFNDTHVVRHNNNSGWEPFDTHNCGRMSNDDLAKCFDLMFGSQEVDTESLNEIYSKTATRPLHDIGSRDILGFKMRYKAPDGGLLGRLKFSSWNDFTRGISNNHLNSSYKKMMFELFKKHNITVFFAVRQDILKWGLSKYHGDGTGKKGHMQFELATGKISEDDVGKLTVDIGRLEKIIKHCQYVHDEKKALFDELKSQGINCAALRYEDFLEDKTKYFQDLYRHLGVEKNEDEVNASVAEGTSLKKVHKDDISSFVNNHEEVMAQFGKAFVAW